MKDYESSPEKKEEKKDGEKPLLEDSKGKWFVFISRIIKVQILLLY